MKTIDINLIGEFDKAPEYNKSVIRKDHLDTSTRVIMMAFLIGVFVTFVISFGVWLIADNLGKNHSVELKKLKTELQKLEKEKTKMSIFRTNLQQDLKTAKFKLLAKNQINDSFIPWSSVLKELAAKIPRNIIISDIDKSASRRTSGNINRLSISGIVPVSGSSRVKPFTTVSFLILNINEDKYSLLYDAEIKKIEYDLKADIYSFEIETGIHKEKPVKKDIPAKEENIKEKAVNQSGENSKKTGPSND